jgi:hypothetical protein
MGDILGPQPKGLPVSSNLMGYPRVIAISQQRKKLTHARGEARTARI